MKRTAVALALAGLAGCATEQGSVMDKVLQDFGLQERPEGYVSSSDRVFERLSEVGQSELRRLNTQGRHGEVKFAEQDGIQGKFYKEVKVYENFYPLDATAAARTASGERGYIGYIEYGYQIYQSERKNTRAEAEAESANIPTGVTGREGYRYRFNSAGMWNGAPGEPARR